MVASRKPQNTPSRQRTRRATSHSVVSNDDWPQTALEESHRRNTSASITSPFSPTLGRSSFSSSMKMRNSVSSFGSVSSSTPSPRPISRQTSTPSIFVEAPERVLTLPAFSSLIEESDEDDVLTSEEAAICKRNGIRPEDAYVYKKRARTADCVI